MAAVGRETSGHEKQHYSWSRTPSTATNDRARRKLSWLGLPPYYGPAGAFVAVVMPCEALCAAASSSVRISTGSQAMAGGSLLHVKKLPAHPDAALHPGFPAAEEFVVTHGQPRIMRTRRRHPIHPTVWGTPSVGKRGAIPVWP